MSNQLWDRQRDEQGELEPMLWFDRFTLHRQCGPGRNLLSTFNKSLAQPGAKRRTSVPSSWFRASKKWAWDERAEAWDEHERQRIEAKFQQECDAWRANRFSGAQQLWDIGKKMLDTFPVARQTVKKDGETTIIEPITGVLAEIARVWKLADELARTTTRETLPVKKIAPTDPSGEKPYDLTEWLTARQSRLDQLNQLNDGETQDT